MSDYESWINGNDADMYFGEACGAELNLKCPYCNSDYTQIDSAGTLQGHDKMEAVEAFPGTVKSGDGPARRSAVQIVIECEECQGKFGFVVQQHKGMNFIRLHLIKPPVDEQEAES